ncbi:MAG: ECF transporter S component [Clostridia bacterium]|nr:ECF transporter S component [Clostridia bacterium]
MATITKTVNVRKLVYLAILTALVILLQLVFAPLIGSATGLSPALVFIPIVLGVSVCGIFGGAWLGAVFSFIVLFDPTTVPFFEYRPFFTVLLVFMKGVGAALIAGLIFKLLRNKNRYVAITLAALAAPVVNTAIFVLGCYAFFLELTGVEIYALFTTVNFGVEVAVNIIMVPVVYRILEVSKISLN